MTETNNDEEGTARLFNDEDYGLVLVQDDFLFNLQDKAGILSRWMLLDSQSTVAIFCNLRMLSSIYVLKIHLILKCYMGTISVTKKGNLEGYVMVWYHPTGIANILSLNNVKKKYRVIFDSNLKYSFVIHKGYLV